MKWNAKEHPCRWLSALPFVWFLACWAPAAFVRHVIPHRRDFVRMAAGETQWWCQPGGINRKLQDCFQENMQADAVPFLKDYDTYTASLPVRERGISKPLKLYQLLFYVRDSDLDAFAARIAADEQRPTVAYIAAASHSGKSASVLVGFLRAREQNTVDGQRALNSLITCTCPLRTTAGTSIAG